MPETDVSCNSSQTSRTARECHTTYQGLAADAAEPWDLVTVPARQGLEAVDILRRTDPLGAHTAPVGVGPVLHDRSCDTLGFLVPSGTAARWDLPGSACIGIHKPGASSAEATQPPVAGTGWLVPPGEADPVTDPRVLRAALGEAARTIAAADSCR